MRLPVLACLLSLALCGEAAAGDLYATINRLRDGEGHCAASRALPPLKPQAALERVARDLARGKQLEASLVAAGYRATRASAMTFSGSGVGARAAEILESQSDCRQLLEVAMSEVGIYLDARQLWIVMAAPFAPTLAMDAQASARRLLELVNQTRARPRNCGKVAFRAARPLRWNEALAEAARRHSEDMARFSYLSHDGRDGSNPAQRVERAGYRYRAIGENIAGGQTSPEDAVASWISSPGHCANLMNSVFTEMGAAVAVDRRSKLGVYWAQEFGAPR